MSRGTHAQARAADSNRIQLSKQPCWKVGISVRLAFLPTDIRSEVMAQLGYSRYGHQQAEADQPAGISLEGSVVKPHAQPHAQSAAVNGQAGAQQVLLQQAKPKQQTMTQQPLMAQQQTQLQQLAALQQEQVVLQQLLKARQPAATIKPSMAGLKQGDGSQQQPLMFWGM